MTPKYWMKIIAGILGIFVVGMVLRAGVNKGRQTVKDVVHGDGPINIPLLGMPFRMDNIKLGSLQQLRIERSAPKMVTGFHLAATLDDSTALARFEDCRLTVTNPNHIDEKTSFRCATATDSATQVLVPFGSITLAPSGKEYIVLLPESVRRDIQKEGANVAPGDGEDADVQIDSGEHGGLSVKVNGKNIVSMHGDSNGGRLVVHDANGKEVVNIRATAPPPPSTVKKP